MKSCNRELHLQLTVQTELRMLGRRSAITNEFLGGLTRNLAHVCLTIKWSCLPNLKAIGRGVCAYEEIEGVSYESNKNTDYDEISQSFIQQ